MAYLPPQVAFSVQAPARMKTAAQQSSQEGQPNVHDEHPPVLLRLTKETMHHILEQQNEGQVVLQHLGGQRYLVVRGTRFPLAPQKLDYPLHLHDFQAAASSSSSPRPAVSLGATDCRYHAKSLPKSTQAPSSASSSAAQPGHSGYSSAAAAAAAAHMKEAREAERLRKQSSRSVMLEQSDFDRRGRLNSAAKGPTERYRSTSSNRIQDRPDTMRARSSTPVSLSSHERSRERSSTPSSVMDRSLGHSRTGSLMRTKSGLGTELDLNGSRSSTPTPSIPQQGRSTSIAASYNSSSTYQLSGSNSNAPSLRQRILHLLAAGPRTQRDILEALPIDAPTASVLRLLSVVAFTDAASAQPHAHSPSSHSHLAQRPTAGRASSPMVRSASPLPATLQNGATLCTLKDEVYKEVSLALGAGNWPITASFSERDREEIINRTRQALERLDLPKRSPEWKALEKAMVGSSIIVAGQSPPRSASTSKRPREEPEEGELGEEEEGELPSERPSKGKTPSSISWSTLANEDHLRHGRPSMDDSKSGTWMAMASRTSSDGHLLPMALAHETDERRSIDARSQSSTGSAGSAGSHGSGTSTSTAATSVSAMSSISRRPSPSPSASTSRSSLTPSPTKPQASSASMTKSKSSSSNSSTQARLKRSLKGRGPRGEELRKEQEKRRKWLEKQQERERERETEKEGEKSSQS